MIIDVYSAVLFLFGLLFLVFFVYSASRQNNSLSAPFAILSMATAIYTIGYGFELQADNLKTIEFFLNLEYFGISFIPAFWFIVSYKYRYKKKVPIKILIPVLTISFLTLFFRETNEYHHLIHTSMSLIHAYGHNLVISGKGLWYSIHIGSYYAAMIFGLIVYFQEWKKSGYRIKSQSFWMLMSPLLPSVLIVIYLTGCAPMMLDLAPLGLTLSAVMIFISLFRYDFLELKEMIKEIAFLEINEGILVVDEKGRLIDFNKAASRFFHWLDLNLIGVEVSCYEEGRHILEQKEEHFEFEVQRDHRVLYLELRETVLKEHNKIMGSVYFIQDITKQKENLHALRHMAAFDALTNLYNRRKLMESCIVELDLSRSSGRCVSALMIDIDHFKLTNDCYGHLAGDEALKQIARVCKEKVKDIGIIGRYGGEEFFALLPGVESDEAFLVAEKIRKAVEELDILYMGKELHITVSIGLETEGIITPEFSLDDLVSKADKALYEAKAKGRNQVSLL